MKKVYTLSMLIMIAISQSYITSTCKCPQLLSEDDCLKNFDLNCEWNSTKQQCNNAKIPSIQKETIITYCSNFSETDCPKTQPCDTCGAYAACQWYDNQCTHFTGCTAHQRTTDYECQAISNRCITDGIHCVEIGQCDSYLNELSCKRNQFLRYCYWNSNDSKCQDANTCEKLPIILNTDKLCRKEISTCVTLYEGGCKETGINCSDQKLEIQCVWNKEMNMNCYWNGVECQDKICDNAPKYMVSDNICKTFLSICTTKLGGGCIIRTTCREALIEAACIQNNNGENCYWNGTECMDKICSNAPISMTNNDSCSNFKANCITKYGGGCVDNLQCVAADIEQACVKNIYGQECIFVNNQCKERLCDNAPVTYNSHDLCESFLSTCTVKYGGGCQNKTCINAPITIITNIDCEFYLPNNNCIAKQDGGCEYLSICSEITLKDNCIKDFKGNDCIFDGTCKNKTCANSPTSNNSLKLCQIYLPTCTIDSNNKCIEKTCENIVSETQCTIDSNNKLCKWQNKCVSKQCVFASQTLITIEECQKYKSICTLSDLGYGCIQIPLRCEVFTNEVICNINIRQNGQEINFCGWNGVICVDKSCDTAPKHIVHNVLCSQYLDGCVLAESGKGCQELPLKCEDRKYYDICINEQGQNCVWNIISNLCVEKSCETASIFGIVGKLAIFNSENCFNYHKCLVHYDGISGCISHPQNCYSLSKANCQSRFIYNNIQCHWIDADQTCKEMQCENYLFDECEAKQCIRNKTGSGCQQREICSSYNQIQCTEASKNQNGELCVWNINLEQPQCQEKSCYTAPYNFDDHLKCSQYGECTVAFILNTDQLIYGGCIPLSNCSSYLAEKQCILNVSKSKCEWIDQKCEDFSCLTAPRYYDSHQACQTYKQGCTVNFYKQGCMQIPDKCEYMIFEQCLYDKNGNQCYWLEESHICITKTCNNAPKSLINAKGCETYLQECTQFNDFQCKTKVCEDFEYTTDFECRIAMSNCTTDGVKCVLRGTCFQALAQAGCITSSSGINCAWIDNSYCKNKNCDTAPLNLKTESQCTSYYTGCTTKNNGGCVKKSTCTAADTRAACTTSSLGLQCVWDIDKCRNEDCQDLNGKTHLDCKTQMFNCTIGLNGKCSKIQICEDTTIRQACIEGANGPCLWIAGACYSYQSCKSLSWTTNQQCKQISSQCTTNGNNCVSIAKCQETNTNGGCFTGYDGECIQYKSSQSDTKCKLYTQCSDVHYLTHEECQSANQKCTTNKQTGCIELNDCSSYNNIESCKINDKGISDKNNETTGICIWDEFTSTCRDQKCADLVYATHELCNSIFNKCTSNGINCVTLNKCLIYSQNSCNIGLDGACLWDVQRSQCKLKTCNDIQNGITNDICSKELPSCISNGITCVQFSNCSTYSTQKACNFGGTDGICVWQSLTGICNLMTSCLSASNDENACVSSKLKCNWIPYDPQSVMSKCETHTCATYQQTNGNCSRFLNWDSKSQEICAIVNGDCQQTNPASLTQSDCNIITGNTYTWNTQNKTCDVCENSAQNVNNLTKFSSYETSQTETATILCLTLVIYLI